MTYQQKENSGSLFRNNKREKDTHPNAKGSALIDGVEYWISSWTKETSEGQKWQSLSFKRKDTASAPAPQPQRTHGQMKRGGAQQFEHDGMNSPKEVERARQARTGFDDMDDGIPFDNPYRGRYSYVV